MSDPRIDPLRIDVGHLLRRSVVSLYSSLVTRPTGRAVRIAIESQLGEVGGATALSVIDLSEVTLLDFSCADEVVAKLLQRSAARGDREGTAAFFLFHGLAEPHREPIEAALERQELALVAQLEDGRTELVGSRSEEESEAWVLLEGRGRIDSAELGELPDAARTGLRRLAQRRLAYLDPDRGAFHALTSLVGDLGAPPSEG